MKQKTKVKLPHTMRYFLVFGFGVFFCYWKGLYTDWMLLLLGPSIYFSGAFKLVIEKFITIPPHKDALYFGVLFPAALFYYGVISMLFKNLWGEKGILRIISILGLAAFVAYIHYLAWKNLTGYMLKPF